MPSCAAINCSNQQFKGAKHTVQDATQLLSVTADSVRVNDMQKDMSVAQMYDLQDRSPIADEHDYADIPNSVCLSQYKMAVITYIAGYVVRMVRKKISCPDCQFALTVESEQQVASIGCEFMLLKNRGGLIKASSSVVMVCEETEKCFQRMHTIVGDNLPQARNSQ